MSLFVHYIISIKKAVLIVGTETKFVHRSVRIFKKIAQHNTL